jgi:hypothetical protein
MTIHSKLHQVQSQLSTVSKQGENKFQHYQYVMLGTILEAVNPLLKEVGLVITQSITKSDASLQFTDNCYYSTAHVELDTTVIDESNGESLTIGSSGFAADKNSDKALFKAITGARKYGLTMLLKLHWDSVEPEEDSPALGAKPKSRRAPAHQVIHETPDFF